MKKIVGIFLAVLLGFGWASGVFAHSSLDGPLVFIEGGLIHIDEAILTGGIEPLCLTHEGNLWGNDEALGREACDPENLFTRVIVLRRSDGSVKKAFRVIEAWKVSPDENGEFRFSARQGEKWILNGDENELKAFRGEKHKKLREASKRLGREKTALGRSVQIDQNFKTFEGQITRSYVIRLSRVELENISKFLEMFSK